MPNTPKTLIDAYGRQVDYIRLSITDRCDFRCTYCMGEDVSFLSRDEVLSLEECARIVKAFVSLGVQKIRITGGEPLVRKNAIWLFEEIGQLSGVRELVTTTNGSQLEQHAKALKAAGVRRVNISLDSLDAERFKSITRVGTLSLVRFAIDQEIDISFIEEMPIGMVEHTRNSSFVSNTETLATIKKDYALISSDLSTGGPARYWQIANTNTKVGFISPHSHNFCEACNRVRITCKGELYLCLGQDDKIELMPILRAYPDDDAPLMNAIIDSMKIKPKGHDFDLNRAEPAVIRFMSHTGG